MTKFESLSLRLLIKKPRHTITMILGIALGVAIIVAALGIGQSAFNYFNKSVSTVLGKADLVVSNDVPFNQQTVQDSLKGLQIKETASQLVSPARASINKHLVNTQIIAIDPQETPKLWPVKIDKGQFKITENDIVMSNTLATQLNAKVGDNIKLLTGGGSIEKRLSGTLVETGLGRQGGVFADLAAFQKSQGLEGKINLFYIELQDKDLLSKTKTILSKRLDTGIKVGILPASSEYITKMLQSVKSLLLFVGIFALIIGAFLIYQTTNTIIMERLYMISMLKSFGAIRSQLLKLFLLESALVGLVSSVIGIAIGQGLIFALSSATGNILQRGLSSYFLPISAGIVVGLGTSLSATVFPILKVTKLSVARGLSSQSNEKKRLEGLPSVALLIETLIPIVKKVMPLSLISIRSVTFNFRRFYLIAMALCVSVAMLIGIIIGVSAMDYGIWGFFNELKGSYFAIRPQTYIGAGINTRLPLSKIKEIEKIKGVGKISPNHFGNTTYKGDSVIYRFYNAQGTGNLIAVKSDESFAMNSKSLAVKKFRSGGYAFVSESFAEKRNVHVNEVINIKIGDKSHAFKVAAVLVEVRDGVDMLTQDGLRYFDINQYDEVQIWPEKGQSLNGLKKRLQNYVNKQGYALLTNKEVESQINVMLNGFSAFLIGLVSIIFIIISLGVGNMVLVNSLSRVRLLGVMRASGMTRRQLIRTLASESLLVGLISLPFSLVVGYIIGMYFTKFLYISLGMSVKQGVNWFAMPMVVLAILAILYFVAAFSARRIAKISVADALRYE